MATFAFAAGGAFLTSSLGLGASTGWLVGSILGKLLFPPEGPHSEGPRLKELRVSTSAYGQPIPIVYGTVRVGGNMFWKGTAVEHQHVEESGGGGKGGGGSTSTYTYYTYSLSFAIGIAEGELDRLIKIWADGKIIYDRSGTSNVIKKKGLSFRFYTGSETQLPDSIIEAEEGAGNVPAYRGLSYIVFDDLDLTDYGNRPPQIQVLVASSTTETYPQTSITVNDGATTAFGTYWAYDRKRKLMYMSPSAGTGRPILARVRVPSMVEEFWISESEWEAPIVAEGGTTGNGVQPICVDPITGYLYCDDGSADNNTCYYKVDPVTLLPIAGLDPDYTDGGPNIVSGAIVNVLTPMAVAGATADADGYMSYLVVQSIFGVQTIVDCYDMAKLDTISSSGTEISPPIIGEQLLGETGVYFVDHQENTTASIKFWRMEFDSAGAEAGASYGIDYVTLKTYTFAELKTALGSDFSAATSLKYSSYWVYDPDTNSLLGVFSFNGADNAVVSFSLDTLTFNWVSTTTAATISKWEKGEYNYDMGATDKFVLAASSEISVYDKYTGDLIWHVANTASAGTYNTGMSSDSGGTYDPDFDLVLSNTGGAFFIDRVSGGSVTLKSVVDDLCERSSVLTNSDLVSSDLAADSVRGYVVGHQMSIRAALEPLASAYYFDAVESDYLLYFLKRGIASVDTLTEADLARLSKQETWLTDMVQEPELPMRINTVYVDIDRDYEEGTQTAKRIIEPYPSMYSADEVSVAIPIVLNAQEAKQIAETSLYTSWVERSRYQFSTSWEFLNLNPTDVITANMDNGTTYTARLTSMNIGADMSISFNALAEETATYSSTADTDTNQFTAGVLQGGDNATFLKVHNIPLLNDNHDSSRANSLLYLQGAPLVSGVNWSGCYVYKSTDRITWTLATVLINEMCYGSITGALADPPSTPFAIDTTSTLTIWPISGEGQLVSITDAQFLSKSSNLMRVGNELIYFRDVTDNGDGSYTISHFMRGRRGTDIYATGHTTGERFYLILESTTNVTKIPLGDIGTAHYFKAVGFGESFEAAGTVVLTPTGEDLKPYAPVNVTRTDDSPSAGDITIAWDRRSRLYGDLTTPPLAEDSESYEVDILSGTGGSVLRTLSSTSESVEYDTAQITTDFGSPPTTLYVRVYQVSAQVGRGFSYEYALTV